MLTGPLQRLPGASEGWGGTAHETAHAPWLLPITDGAAPDAASDAVAQAVRRAARPFQLAANGLAFGLTLLLAAQIATSFLGAGSTGRSADQVASAPVAIQGAPVLSASAVAP